MLIQRLLPLAFLLLTAPSFAQAQTGTRGLVEEPSPESTQNNNLNGNLSAPAAETQNQEAPMAPVPPESAAEPSAEDKPPEAAPQTAPAPGSQPPAATGETAPESQGPTQLDIPEVPAPRTLDGKAMPVRGMTMKEVERQFGKPQEKRPAVGKPPIIRWIYGDYTVYFERQYVIHSVPNETLPTVPEKEAVPEQPVPEQPPAEQGVPEQPAPEQPPAEQAVPEQPVPEQPPKD